MSSKKVPWFDSLPEKWSLTTLGKLFKERKNKNKLGRENNLLSLSYGKIVRKNIKTNEGLLPENFNGYNIIEANDIVLRLTDLQNDHKSLRSALATERGIITSAYITLQPTAPLNAGYFAYLFRAIDLAKVFYTMGNGIRQGLNYDELAKMPLPYPDEKEQKIITNCLDEKCSSIDSLIESKQQTLAKLARYRQSIITEAVTKGLNPKTALKKSGIQWVTDIPKHWKTINPKGYFRERKERATEGMIQCTASQKYGVIPQAEYMRLTGSRVVVVTKNFDILKAVHCGDFIIHMRSFQGGLELSTMDCCVSSAYVGLIPDNKAIVNEYFRWLFKCVPYIQALRNTSNLIRDGQAMRFWNFIQVPLILPPKDEQIAIAKYLTTTCEKMDRLSESINKTIVLLTKYRNSLITEAVTGQIDCTGN